MLLLNDTKFFMKHLKIQTATSIQIGCKDTGSITVQRMMELFYLLSLISSYCYPSATSTLSACARPASPPGPAAESLHCE